MPSLPEDIKTYIYKMYFSENVLKELLDTVNRIESVIHCWGYCYIEFAKPFVFTSSLSGFLGERQYVFFDPVTSLCYIPPHDYYRFSFKQILSIKHR